MVESIILTPSSFIAHRRLSHSSLSRVSASSMVCMMLRAVSVRSFLILAPSSVMRPLSSWALVRAMAASYEVSAISSLFIHTVS